MIKIDNNTPTDITWTENSQVYTVTAIKKDGVFVYGRSGTYKTGTLPTGVASLTCTKTVAECEPTSTTGTVANNAVIYHGDKLYWTATASAYYTVSVPYYNSSSSTYYTNFLTTRTATGVSLCGVTAERATRSVTATINDHIRSIAVSFTKKSDGGSGSTLVTSSRAIADVWQGGAITYTPSPNLYWEASSGTIAAGAWAVSISPTATRKERSVTATINSNISSIAVSYTNLSGQSASATKTSTGSVSGVWQGGAITYTVTPATYWASSGGSYSAGTSAINISPTASRATRTTLVQMNDHISSVKIMYTKASDGESATVTRTDDGSLDDVWQGARISIVPEAELYWKSLAYFISAGTSAATIAPIASRAPRDVSVNVNDNINSVTVTYTDTSTGSSASSVKTTSGSVSNVWQGAGITYTVTPATYWTSSGGSYEAGTSAITISPTARRAGRYAHVTINSNITSVTSSYTSSLTGESTSSTRTSSGYLAAVWQGGRIDVVPEAAQYWTSQAYFIPAGTSDAEIAPVASRAPRSVTAIVDGHVTGITVTYTSTETGSSATTTRTSTGSVSNVWQGAGISYSVATEDYWSSAPGTYEAGTSAVNIYPTTTRTARSVSVGINTNVSSVTVNYTKTSDGTSGSTTRTSSGSVSGVWQGAQITYTGAASTYWYVPSGTVQAGTSSVSIAPTAVRTPRTVSVTKPAGAAMTATGINPSTGTSSTVSVSTANRYVNDTTVLANKFWQGNKITWSATPPSGMAILPISGTITAGTGTATISTELVTQRNTLDTTSNYVTWTASEASATTEKRMAVTRMAANTSNTICDKTTIYYSGRWYHSSSSTTGSYLTITDKAIPATASTKAKAVLLATYNGNLFLYGYRSGDRDNLRFYVANGSTAMRLTKTALKADVWTTGAPEPPEIEDDDEYGAYIYNPNPYPVQVYISGNYHGSDQAIHLFSNTYWITLDAYAGKSWSGDYEEYLLDANLDFYFAGDVKTTSNVSNYSYN